MSCSRIVVGVAMGLNPIIFVLIVPGATLVVVSWWPIVSAHRGRPR